MITHIEEGLDFLGWRIQRHRKRGTDRSYVYTYPARKALRAVMGKVKTWCRRMDTNQPLEVLLLRLNPMLRGWCAHFRPGVSSATFAYLSAYTWARVIAWVRPKHPPDHLETTPPPLLRGRMVAGHHRTGAVQPGEGAHHALPLPGRSHPGCVADPRMRTTPAQTGLVERPLLGKGHGGCGRRLGKPTGRNTGRAPRVDLTGRRSGLVQQYRIGAVHDDLVVRDRPQPSPELVQEQPVARGVDVVVDLAVDVVQERAATHRQAYRGTPRIGPPQAMCRALQRMCRRPAPAPARADGSRLSAAWAVATPSSRGHAGLPAGEAPDGTAAPGLFARFRRAGPPAGRGRSSWPRRGGRARRGRARRAPIRRGRCRRRTRAPRIAPTPGCPDTGTSPGRSSRGSPPCTRPPRSDPLR